jgi:hypothetical protein
MPAAKLFLIAGSVTTGLGALAMLANLQAGTLTNQSNLMAVIALTTLGAAALSVGFLLPMFTGDGSGPPAVPQTLPATDLAADKTGRFVLMSVEQRDLDALHHLSSRAAKCRDKELRTKMLDHCRHIGDCVFTMHHGREAASDESSIAS